MEKRQTRRAATPPATPPAPPPAPEFVEGEVDDIDVALERVLDELGGGAGATINVFRIEKGQRDAFLDSFAPVEFDGEASALQTLRDRFGPGDYRIYIRAHNKIALNRRVAIASGPRPGGGNGAAGGGPELLAGLAQLVDAQNRNFAELLNVIRDQAGTEEKLIARLKAMRELVAPAPAAAAAAGVNDAIGSVRSLMSMFSQGLDLGRSLEAPTGANSTDVILEAVRTLAPALVRAVEPGLRRLPPSRGPAKASAGAAPPASGAAGAAASATPGAGADKGKVMEFRAILAMLIDAAKRDADPRLYAEVTFDQVGLEDLQLLWAKGDPVDTLQQHERAVGDHRAWFAELRDALEGIIHEEQARAVPEDDTHGDPAGSVRDQAHPADHGGAGEAGAQVPADPPAGRRAG